MLADDQPAPPHPGQVARGSSGIVACGWFVFLIAIGGEAQNPYCASIAAVGLMIAFYYGLTGIVCVVYYRRYLLTSWRNFVFVGLMPGIGGLGAGR